METSPPVTSENVFLEELIHGSVFERVPRSIFFIWRCCARFISLSCIWVDGVDSLVAKSARERVRLLSDIWYVFEFFVGTF